MWQITYALVSINEWHRAEMNPQGQAWGSLEWGERTEQNQIFHVAHLLIEHPNLYKNTMLSNKLRKPGQGRC